MVNLWVCVVEDPAWWPGGDRLSRALRRSTMGAGVFHGRVRYGIGCIIPAIATGPPGRILVLMVRRLVGSDDVESGLVLRAVPSLLMAMRWQ